jgi:hypothetical protein
MEVQEPMLQSHAKSLIPGNKVLMTLLLRLRLRPTMSSQIPKIELRQRLTVLNLISQIWKNIHTTAIIDISALFFAYSLITIPISVQMWLAS